MTPVTAEAHHEAMFGPQSSAVLSPGVFLSAQLFDREKGRGNERRREATTVWSAAAQPFKRPLSIAVVVPFTYATYLDSAPSKAGFEDALISARYRVGVDRMKSAFGLDDSYVIGVGGVEIPTGTLDHRFGRGSVGGIVAGLMSVEKRPLAGIGYAYYHHTTTYGHLRPSGHLFIGTGVAFTPIDDDASGHLLSLQIGGSYEHTRAVQEHGIVAADGGASGTFLHPGVVFSMSSRVRFFGLGSVPLTQRWRSISDRQRFRLGAGTIVIFGH